MEKDSRKQQETIDIMDVMIVILALSVKFSIVLHMLSELIENLYESSWLQLKYATSQPSEWQISS